MQMATAGRLEEEGGMASATFLSGNDVGKDPAADQDNLVFQPKFALFQTLQFQLVERLVFGKPLDYVIKITMLAFQGFKPGFQ